MRRSKAPRRGKLRVGVCALIAIAPLVFVHSARASHPPAKHEVQQIVIDHNQGRAVALGLRFGGYVLDREGLGWSSVCAAALGSDDSETYPGVSRDGSLVVSTGLAGIARSADGCGWSVWHPDFPAFFVDLRASGAGLLFALSSTADAAGFATQLWRSTDGGESWLPHGEPLPPDLAATSFAISPSSAARFYIAGSGTNGVELLRSDDAGASWQRFAIEHAGTPRQIQVASAGQDVLAVLLEAHQHDEPGSTLTDSVHVSLDAGEHFGSLYESSGDLRAAALSDSGQLAFGGSEGLFVTDVAHRGGPKRRELAPETSVQALAWAGARLFAGVSDADGAISLLESDDGGARFSAVVSLCDVAPAVECSGASTVSATCTGDTESQVSLNAEALPWCASAPPPSPPPTGASAQKAEPDAGSCSLGSAPAGRSELIVLLAASLLLLGVASRRSGAPYRRFSAGRAAARARRPRARPRT